MQNKIKVVGVLLPLVFRWKRQGIA